MRNWLSDRTISCPYCAESMHILIDSSAGAQTYIEDCQICCQPMQITFDASETEVLNLRVERGD
jgi:Cysteine-rich CPXCG